MIWAKLRGTAVAGSSRGEAARPLDISTAPNAFKAGYFYRPAELSSSLSQPSRNR